MNKKSLMEKKENDEENFSGGTIIFCDSMKNSNIVHCNMRLKINKESMVVKNIKDSILRMGIKGVDSEKSMQKELNKWS